MDARENVTIIEKCELLCHLLSYYKLPSSSAICLAIATVDGDSEV